MNKVVYASRGGNTKKLAEAVARGACVSANSVEQLEINDTDILFVGASIYAGKIDARLRSFLEIIKPEQVKTVVVFGTAAGNKTALPEIKALLEPKGIFVSSDVFHCNGSFLFANRGRPNAEDLKNAESFAKKICGEKA
ncbi:flavodoxin [Clostridiaceae bacterium OttesenSCG-928-D20]|nr:flavodoxin [Clostridiaceae bacterium OttesenSCG-928-D20]